MLDVLTKRKIHRLVHFTRAANLPSILQRGLISRAKLTEKSITHCVNDALRYDYLPNGICLSVMFPNYRMFYRYRQSDAATDWVVIRLKPEIIAEKKCVFCYRNAATHEISDQTVEERRSRAAFESMFADHPGMPARVKLGIPDSFPTDPQAEILVLESIEPSYILDVVVDKDDRLKDRGKLLSLAKEWKGKVKFVQDRLYFDARPDYEHWKA